MKMTGTCAIALFCLSLRHVVNPSSPGITASIRMTSGVTFSAIASASSPSRATRTVIPAFSIASVSIPRVSGESSTTRTIVRMCFLCMGASNRIERRQVAFDFEHRYERAQVCHEIRALRRIIGDAGEMFVYPADMADLAQPNQFVYVLLRRQYVGKRRAWRRGALRHPVGVDPFDIEQRVNLLEELAQADRLHQKIVVQLFG